MDGARVLEQLYTEDRVAPAERVLGLRGVLSEAAARLIQQNMRPALRTAQRNLPVDEISILKRMADEFLSMPALVNGLFIAASFGYADIPLGKAYSVIFDRQRPPTFAGTQCVLRAVINEWMPIAMDGIPHEHRTVCLFDFPQGIPELVLSLPEVTYPTPTGIEEKLFLCNQETWELRKRQPMA